MLIAALIAAPFGLAEAGAALLSPPILATGFAVALMTSALPYSLEMVALRRLDRGTFGVLMSLEPAIAALAAFTLLDGIVVETVRAPREVDEPEKAASEGAGAFLDLLSEGTDPLPRKSAII